MLLFNFSLSSSEYCYVLFFSFFIFYLALICFYYNISNFKHLKKTFFNLIFTLHFILTKFIHSFIQSMLNNVTLKNTATLYFRVS